MKKKLVIAVELEVDPNVTAKEAVQLAENIFKLVPGEIEAYESHEDEFIFKSSKCSFTE